MVASRLWVKCVRLCQEPELSKITSICLLSSPRKRLSMVISSQIITCIWHTISSDFKLECVARDNPGCGLLEQQHRYLEKRLIKRLWKGNANSTWILMTLRGFCCDGRGGSRHRHSSAWLWAAGSCCSHLSACHQVSHKHSTPARACSITEN